MVEAPKPKAAEEGKVEEKKEEAVEGVQMDVLEEDDDFEEFEENVYEDSALNADEKVEWEDNWDDEEDDDDFASRLRAEVGKYAKAQPATKA